MTPGWLEQAEALRQRGALDDALQVLRQGLVSSPEDVRAHEILAQIHQDAGRLDLAAAIRREHLLPREPRPPAPQPSAADPFPLRPRATLPLPAQAPLPPPEGDHPVAVYGRRVWWRV